MISRQQMEAAIKAGGSVLHEGRCLTKLEELPTEADLAVGDVPRLKGVLASLDTQIAKLHAEREQATHQLKEAEEGARAKLESLKGGKEPVKVEAHRQEPVKAAPEEEPKPPAPFGPKAAPGTARKDK